MEMAFIYGKMVENTMDNGRIMTWKVLVYIFGQMEEDTKVSITMIKNVDTEFTIGQMAGNMKDGGIKENSMV